MQRVNIEVENLTSCVVTHGLDGKFDSRISLQRRECECEQNEKSVGVELCENVLFKMYNAFDTKSVKE